MQDIPIMCKCGKVILKVRDGELFGYCKRCKREIEIELPAELNLYRKHKK